MLAVKRDRRVDTVDDVADLDSGHSESLPASWPKLLQHTHVPSTTMLSHWRTAAQLSAALVLAVLLLMAVPPSREISAAQQPSQRLVLGHYVPHHPATVPPPAHHVPPL